MKGNRKSGNDIAGATAALRRASRAAWKLARQTKTPFHVWKNGRIVNLNSNARNGRTR